MIKRIVTHFIAAYLGAGLFGAMTMGTFLPLSNLGMAYYMISWPEHLYCVDRECGPTLLHLPPEMQAWFFNL